MPFQAASTLSSVPGLTRRSRASNRTSRASSISAASSVASSPNPGATADGETGRQSTLVSSQFPCGVAPKQVATGSPTSATSSSHDQTKNRPSTPSLSASCDDQNPPSGCWSSRSRYSAVSTATRRMSSFRVTCQARA